jgi:hypothetical protein
MFAIQSGFLMRRNRGSAIAQFLEDLGNGDPFALSIAGGFALVCLIAAIVIWRVSVKLKREDESRTKRYGRS